MSAEKKPRKHRHKRHYTFMVISGDSDGSTKRLHLNHFKTQVLAYTAFALALAIICYIIYSAITISNLRAIEDQQRAQIDELTTASSTLEASNDELETKVQQLSAALNQRLEDEQISAEEAETLAVPTGFPLTGTASLTPAVDDPNETKVTKLTEDNKDSATGNPIVLLESAAGNSVIASGSGTILTVTTDAKFGNIVTIDHGNGYVSIYRNSGDPLVTEGSQIDKGDIIFVITDDNTTLGYQIQQNEQYIDPEELIEING
ncbi:MAG: M23 family metallopeptidase [Butyrivibrio sp.]|uniref:M23 family metallopeptidase n=1 Tax=Butyrivibrio sp. TaxID=28121 RepID=UPI001B521786|nr:M23 family metallopeptidase [Butyrivibrio sp.]MBP3783003.1 M23 family metallopeptidase [Butyrivibrio sp.]